MACVLANRTKGYLYDIFEKTKLITSIAFMSKLVFAAEKVYTHAHTHTHVRVSLKGQIVNL